jgi:hypothetical protein
MENPGLKYLAVQPDIPAAVGAQITTADCNPTDPAQTLAFNPASGLITHPAVRPVRRRQGDVHRDLLHPGSHATWIICDVDAPIVARAADIVSRLSLADKIAALGTGTPRLPSVGLSAYNWWSEATHGISHVSCTALTITTAASINRTLWRAMGNHIGQEARAFMNLTNAYGTCCAPVINTARDVRWGRILECPGEDPWHAGRVTDAPPSPLRRRRCRARRPTCSTRRRGGPGAGPPRSTPGRRTRTAAVGRRFQPPRRRPRRWRQPSASRTAPPPRPAAGERDGLPQVVDRVREVEGAAGGGDDAGAAAGGRRPVPLRVLHGGGVECKGEGEGGEAAASSAPAVTIPVTGGGYGGGGHKDAEPLL